MSGKKKTTKKADREKSRRTLITIVAILVVLIAAIIVWGVIGFGIGKDKNKKNDTTDTKDTPKVSDTSDSGDTTADIAIAQDGNDETEYGYKINTEVFSKSDPIANGEMAQISIDAPKFESETVTEKLSSLNEYFDLQTSQLKNSYLNQYAMIQNSEDINTHLDYEYSYEVKYQSETFVSVLANIYIFSGGAHGNSRVQGVAYDIENAKMLTLGDIFVTDDYMDFIATRICNEIANAPDGYFVTDAAGIREVLEENAFYLTETGLHIFIQPDTVAPRAAGLIDHEIPFASLTGMIDDRYNLSE